MARNMLRVGDGQIRQSDRVRGKALRFLTKPEIGVAGNIRDKQRDVPPDEQLRGFPVFQSPEKAKDFIMKGALLGSGLVFAEIFSHSASLTYHATQSPVFWCSAVLAGLGMIQNGRRVAQAIFGALTAGE